MGQGGELMPSALTTALAGLALALMCLILGECHGEHRGDLAARNELQAEFQKNLADSTREAALKQQAATIFANALSVELTTTRRSIEAQRASLHGRITYVTREIPADCSFSSDAVRLWNEAWGMPAPGVPQAAGTR